MMMQSIFKIVVMSMLVAASSAFAQDVAKEQKGGVAGRGAVDCIGWRQVARGIYMLKQEGQPKPPAKTELQGLIIDQIYSPATSVATKEMAEAMGEQTCMHYVKSNSQP